MRAVIDTNVILVANGQHKAVSGECIASCISELQNIKTNGKVVIDNSYLIVQEYCQKTRPNTGNRTGDVFLKWLLQNKANLAHCEQVEIVAHPRRVWKSFPDDENLVDFDKPDRKFVAVSNACDSKPPILQAADSRWLKWSKNLKSHGIEVTFLCKQDIQKFRKAKAM
jgi:hypothetical protein